MTQEAECQIRDHNGLFTRSYHLKTPQLLLIRVDQEIGLRPKLLILRFYLTFLPWLPLQIEIYPQFNLHIHQFISKR